MVASVVGEEEGERGKGETISWASRRARRSDPVSELSSTSMSTREAHTSCTRGRLLLVTVSTAIRMQCDAYAGDARNIGRYSRTRGLRDRRASYKPTSKQAPYLSRSPEVQIGNCLLLVGTETVCSTHIMEIPDRDGEGISALESSFVTLAVLSCAVLSCAMRQHCATKIGQASFGSIYIYMIVSHHEQRQRGQAVSFQTMSRSEYETCRYRDETITQDESLSHYA